MQMDKGSKHCRMVVVPYRPVYQFALNLGKIGLAVVAVLLSFQFGLVRGGADREELLTSNENLKRQLSSIGVRDAEMRQSVARAKQSAENDRAASQSLESDIDGLQDKIVMLEQDLDFYRDIMSPGKGKRGLAFGVLNISQGETPDQYDYRLVMQQYADQHQVLNGALTINLVGYKEGELVRLPLKGLSPEVESEKIKLRFRFFQNVTGSLTLPEGFLPERIELSASSKGKGASTVEKTFTWYVQQG